MRASFAHSPGGTSDRSSRGTGTPYPENVQSFDGSFPEISLFDLFNKMLLSPQCGGMPFSESRIVGKSFYHAIAGSLAEDWIVKNVYEARSESPTETDISEATSPARRLLVWLCRCGIFRAFCEEHGWSYCNCMNITIVCAAVGHHAKDVTKCVDTSLDFDKICCDLQSPSGVRIRTMKHRMRRYPLAFSGKDAVDWMAKALFPHQTTQASRDSSVNVLSFMAHCGYLQHVWREQPFRDDEAVYNFCLNPNGITTARSNGFLMSVLVENESGSDVHTPQSENEVHRNLMYAIGEFSDSPGNASILSEDVASPKSGVGRHTYRKRVDASWISVKTLDRIVACYVSKPDGVEDDEEEDGLARRVIFFSPGEMSHEKKMMMVGSLEASVKFTEILLRMKKPPIARILSFSEDMHRNESSAALASPTLSPTLTIDSIIENCKDDKKDGLVGGQDYQKQLSPNESPEIPILKPLHQPLHHKDIFDTASEDASVHEEHLSSLKGTVEGNDVEWELAVHTCNFQSFMTACLVLGPINLAICANPAIPEFRLKEVSVHIYDLLLAQHGPLDVLLQRAERLVKQSPVPATDLEINPLLKFILATSSQFIITPAAAYTLQSESFPELLLQSLSTQTWSPSALPSTLVKAELWAMSYTSAILSLGESGCQTPFKSSSSFAVNSMRHDRVSISGSLLCTALFSGSYAVHTTLVSESTLQKLCNSLKLRRTPLPTMRGQVHPDWPPFGVYYNFSNMKSAKSPETPRPPSSDPQAIAALIDEARNSMKNKSMSPISASPVFPSSVKSVFSSPSPQRGSLNLLHSEHDVNVNDIKEIDASRWALTVRLGPNERIDVVPIWLTSVELSELDYGSTPSEDSSNCSHTIESLCEEHESVQQYFDAIMQHVMTFPSFITTPRKNGRFVAVLSHSIFSLTVMSLWSFDVFPHVFHNYLTHQIISRIEQLRYEKIAKDPSSRKGEPPRPCPHTCEWVPIRLELMEIRRLLTRDRYNCKEYDKFDAIRTLPDEPPVDKKTSNSPLHTEQMAAYSPEHLLREESRPQRGITSDSKGNLHPHLIQAVILHKSSLQPTSLGVDDASDITDRTYIRLLPHRTHSQLTMNAIKGAALRLGLSPQPGAEFNHSVLSYLKIDPNIPCTVSRGPLTVWFVRAVLFIRNLLNDSRSDVYGENRELQRVTLPRGRALIVGSKTASGETFVRVKRSLRLGTTPWGNALVLAKELLEREFGIMTNM